jgi:hypothetical protein
MHRDSIDEKHRRSYGLSSRCLFVIIQDNDNNLPFDIGSIFSDNYVLMYMCTVSREVKDVRCCVQIPL